MDAQTNLDLANRIIRSLRRRKVTECKVSVYEKEESKLAWRAGRIEQSSGSAERYLTVSLYRGGKNTAQTTADLRPDALESFLDGAVAFLDMIPSDPWKSLPDPALQLAVDAQAGTFDPERVSLDSAARLADVRRMYDRARSADPAIVEADTWSYQNHDIATDVFSTGFSNQVERNWFDQGCHVTMLAPDGTRPGGSWGTPTRLANRLGDPDRVVDEAIRRCRRQIGQSKAPTGVYDVVLDNTCAWWLIQPILDGISGWALDQKESVWEGMKGKRIAAAALTVRDDPFLADGYDNRRCDWEGFPARRRDLLYRGVLQDWLVDWYHHRKLGLPLTGGSVSNLVIDPTPGVGDDLLSGTTRAILVHELNGGNYNPVTGDFSVGIAGMLAERGDITRPVNEMLLSGNLKDCLFRLDAAGADQNPWSAWKIPSLRLRDMTVAGS